MIFPKKFNIVTVLKNCIISIVFLITLTPLVYCSNLFFPYVTGKNFYFRILVELAFAFYLLLITINPTYRPRKSPVFLALLLFGIIMALATVLGVDPYRSFWSNFERMEGYVTLLHLIAFFLLTSAVLETPKIWISLWQFSLLVSFLVGLSTLNVEGGHSGGLLGNSTYLAIYTLMHIFIAALLWTQQKQTTRRYVYIFSIFFNLIILYQTGCRGAFIALLTGIFFTCSVFIFSKKTQLQKIALVFLATLFMSAIILKLFITTNYVQNNVLLMRFTVPIHNILHGNFKQLIENEGGNRFLIWQIALQGIADKPLFGWGPENFACLFNLYFPGAKSYNQDWLDRSHNMPLEFFVSGGIFGLIGYLFSFIALLYTLWKRQILSLPEKTLLTTLVIVYFTHNLFAFDHISSYIIFFLLLAYVHALYVQQKHLPNILAIQNKKAIYFFAALMASIFCISLYVINLKPLAASNFLYKTDHADSVEQLLTHYQKALSYETFGNSEIREKLAETAKIVIQTENVPLVIKKAFYDLVNDEFKKQTIETPKNARSYLVYGSFLSQVGSYEEAIHNYGIALALFPNRLDLLLGLCAIYLSQNKFETALSYCKTAFDQAPEIDDTRVTYVLATFYADKEAIFVQLLTDVPKSMQEGVIRRIEQLIQAKPHFRTRGEYFIQLIQSML